MTVIKSTKMTYNTIHQIQLNSIIHNNIIIIFHIHTIIIAIQFVVGTIGT